MSATAMPQKILITGGARGMGAALVQAVLALGFEVVFTYRSSHVEAETLIQEMTALFPAARLSARAVDFADKGQVAAFCDHLAVEGGFYGLIHNAGATYDTLAAIMDQDKAEAVMQVNFFAFTRLVNALVRDMTRARAGRIIAMGSITAIQANQGNAAYAASKGAMLSYVRTLAIETAKRGVTVNYLAPGFVDTQMMAPYAAYRAQMEKQIPAGRFARPEDVAATAAFLLSDGASYITGAVIPIDGGLSAALGVHR